MAPSGSHGRVDVVKRLSQCEIFVNADQSIVSRLVELGSVEFYGPKQIVRYRGDVCNEVLFLVDGETLGLFTNNEGRVLQIDHMLAPKLWPRQSSSRKMRAILWTLKRSKRAFF